MKKSLRTTVIVVGLVFIGIQFIRPAKNLGTESSDHLYRQVKVQPGIQTTLNTSCMDCHSDHTRYHWYHEISPVSWLVRHDIDEGKHELNFSQWGTLDTLDRISALDAIRKEIDRGKMPIKAYTFIHRDAVLSPAQVDSLTSWISTYQKELVNAMQ